ncbi:MAG: Rossmann-like domain-containing protein [Candidatus Hodarchaeota archaeon]
MILEKTVNLVKQIYKIHKIIPPQITKVVIGLGYTGVEVTAYAYEPFLGLASTLPSVIKTANCSKINFAGELTNQPLTKLLDWSIKSPSLKKIIGIATLNGISQHILKIINPYRKFEEKNLVNIVKVNRDTKITFIGLIKPLIREIHKISPSIIVIEDSISNSSEFKDIIIKNSIDQLEKEETPTDILICTGTTLINNTLESILEIFKKKARKIILIGPTASMIPDILFDYGVDIVGGIEIFNSEATLKILQEGGGTKLFKKYGKKYNLIKE